MNGRKKAVCLLGFTALCLAGVAVSGALCHDMAGSTDFSRRNLAPCLEYPFGTDWMGRDMLKRTLAGLSLSLAVGLLTATVSSVLALILGIAAAMGERADAVISFVTDLVMGIPHILLLLLISYACGKGFAGVVTGVALTHWPSLARVIRAEVLGQKNSDYVRIAQKLGTGRCF